MHKIPSIYDIHDGDNDIYRFYESDNDKIDNTG